VSYTSNTRLEQISKWTGYQLITSIRVQKKRVYVLSKMKRPVFPALKRVYISGSIKQLTAVNEARGKLRVWSGNQDLEVIFEQDY